LRGRLPRRHSHRSRANRGRRGKWH
jgi:hypothetical protein